MIDTKKFGQMEEGIRHLTMVMSKRIDNALPSIVETINFYSACFSNTHK